MNVGDGGSNRESLLFGGVYSLKNRKQNRPKFEILCILQSFL